MFTGTLFLFWLAASVAFADAPALDLARGLFAEERWQECRTEAARCLAYEAGNADAAFLKAAAERRCGVDSTAALRAIVDDPTTPALTRQSAECELARALWQAGDPAAALPLFREVFDTAQQRDLFLAAACSIAIILRDNRRLASEHAGLKLQVRTCYPLFTPGLREECDPRPRRTGWTTRPVEWLIRFYQGQVSPAIGARCSLAPSCSAYAVQAMRRHGLLGLAIYADRGYREPDVVAGMEHVIGSGAARKVADPLDSHDWWIRGVSP